jgi:hypothetical protein
METRKDRMAHKYVPKLHDYVKWHHHKYIHEGWIYFYDEEYISIELYVKDKTCTLTDDLHKKHHVLLCCYHWDWYQLEYIKSRKGFNDNSEPDEQII